MSEYLLSSFKDNLAFIENTENYYAMFKNVIDKCTFAKLGNILLYEGGHFTDDEYKCNISRIQRAKERAIATHGEWVIKTLGQSKTPHTRQTLVSSVYADIFGVELKPGTDESIKPEVKKLNFEIDKISSYEGFLKKYFDAYEISGASVEWEAGWRSGIAWCKNIVDKVNKK